MYKLKDKVKFEDLKQFGYQYEEEDGESWYGKYLDDNRHKLFIFEKDRIIKQGKFELIYGFARVELEEKWIKDLKDAGLVEKIGD